MRRVLSLSSEKLQRHKALLAGARALGYAVCHYDQCREGEFDFALCNGARNDTAEGRDFCVKSGIPVLFVELGYMRRARDNSDTEGFFQLGWDRIGGVPAGPVPPDRWEALSLELLPKRELDPSKPALIAGQVGFDAQHKLSTHELGVWLENEARRRLEGWKTVLYRPHPKQPGTRLPGLLRTKLQNPAVCALEEALDAAGVLVTYNSTTGVEAMLRGLPVYSSGSAHYHAAALPGPDVRLEFLCRLAYGQWQLHELRDGSAIEFALTKKPEIT